MRRGVLLEGRVLVVYRGVCEECGECGGERGGGCEVESEVKPTERLKAREREVDMSSTSTRWALHNVVGHPVMGLLHLLGFRGAGDWVHEVTLPKERLELGGGEGGEGGDQLVLSMCMQAEFEEGLMGEVEEALAEVLGDMGEGGEDGEDDEGDGEGGVFR